MGHHQRHLERIRFIKVLAIRKVSIRRARPSEEGANEKSGNSGGRQSGTEKKTEWDSVSGVSERKIYCSEREDRSTRKD